MNMNELTSLEGCIKQIMPLGRPLREGDEHMSAHAMLPDSSDVFSAYVDFAEKGDLEGIKRALFYCWYQWAEPAALYGISGLDDNLVKRVLDVVNELAESGGLDMELRYMLHYYYKVCCWYYEVFDGLEALTAASKREEDSDYKKLFETFDYSNRGLMGDYWSGIGRSVKKDALNSN